jgi:hypothetical protein
MVIIDMPSIVPMSRAALVVVGVGVKRLAPAERISLLEQRLFLGLAQNARAVQVGQRPGNGAKSVYVLDIEPGDKGLKGPRVAELSQRLDGAQTRLPFVPFDHGDQRLDGARIWDLAQ